MSVVCAHMWFHVPMCASVCADAHLHVCVCMCSFSCVHLRVQMYLCICVAACGARRLTSGRHLNCPPLSSLRQSFSLGPRLTDLTNPPSQLAPRFPLSLNFPKAGIIGEMTHLPGLLCGPGYLNSSPHSVASDLLAECLSSLRYSPNEIAFILIDPIISTITCSEADIFLCVYLVHDAIMLSASFGNLFPWTLIVSPPA